MLKQRKKAREAEEKRLKEEKKKDETYNAIIASSPKTVSEVEAIIKKLGTLGEWKDSAALLDKYKEQLKVLKKEEKKLQEEKEAADRLIAERKRAVQYIADGFISACYEHFVCVDSSGNPHQYTNYWSTQGGSPADVSRFSNIKAIVCTNDGIVGLRENGTCISTRPGFTYSYITDCNNWSSIKQIAAGEHHIIGLKENGTCVGNRVKWNTGYGYDGQCDVQGWTNIKQIVCGGHHTIGIRNDKTVVHVGSNFGGVSGVSVWKNVEVIAVANECAVAVDTAGKILSIGGADTSGISGAKNIISLAICGKKAYALLVDGSVVGDKKVAKLKNIVAIKAALSNIYALTNDGKIILIDNSRFGQSKVEIPSYLQLFKNFKGMMEEKEKAEIARQKAIEEEKKRKQEEERRKAEYRAKGVCQYCGGVFKKGLFSTKCLECGHKKDY